MCRKTTNTALLIRYQGSATRSQLLSELAFKSDAHVGRVPSVPAAVIFPCGIPCSRLSPSRTTGTSAVRSAEETTPRSKAPSCEESCMKPLHAQAASQIRRRRLAFTLALPSLARGIGTRRADQPKLAISGYVLGRNPAHLARHLAREAPVERPFPSAFRSLYLTAIWTVHEPSALRRAKVRAPAQDAGYGTTLEPRQYHERGTESWR
ncbi:hypothetical protein BC834DRAFT_600688 [Gloeopeniophorella convolvens]|nr:hypothetical protein BC834DRAFT_600688 [Gloeopeniophorella convolvens]